MRNTMVACLAEAGPYTLQGYEWDAGVSRYRSDETGRFVARTRIIDLLERSTAEREVRFRNGVNALADGRISENTWLARTSAMLQREHVQNAALAAGGWDRLTDADRARISERLTSEFTHLRNLGQELGAGECSVAQAQNRMDMYVGHARAEFYQVERDRLPQAAEGTVTIERRHLAAVKHCGQCVEYYERGWQHEGDLPLPTEECDCDGNCRCTVERREVPVGQAAGWIGHRGGPGDEMVDAGFGEADWDPDLHPRDEEGKFADTGGGMSKHLGMAPRIERQQEAFQSNTTRYLPQGRGYGTAALGKAMLQVNWSAQPIKPTAVTESDPDKAAAFMQNATNEVRSGIKAEGQTWATEHAGISNRLAGELQDSWAISSGDHSPLSVAMQIAAATEFGVDPGNYVPDSSEFSSAPTLSDVFEGRYQLGDENASDGARSYVRAMYARTQTDLEAANVNTVTVYRGIVLPPDQIPLAGATMKHTSNPLSSWTLSLHTARGFGDAFGYGYNMNGCVMAMNVPRERVFALSSSGLGCYREAEVILIGGVEDEAAVLETAWEVKH